MRSSVAVRDRRPDLDVVVDGAAGRGLAEALGVRAAADGVAHDAVAGAARLGRPRPRPGDVDRGDPGVVAEVGDDLAGELPDLVLHDVPDGQAVALRVA